MPTISVDKAELFKAIGKELVAPFSISRLQNKSVLTISSEKYTSKEFDELCFEFGKENSTSFQPVLTNV
jgi:hypothetical protein